MKLTPFAWKASNARTKFGWVNLSMSFTCRTRSSNGSVKKYNHNQRHAMRNNIAEDDRDRRSHTSMTITYAAGRGSRRNSGKRFEVSSSDYLSTASCRIAYCCSYFWFVLRTRVVPSCTQYAHSLCHMHGAHVHQCMPRTKNRDLAGFAQAHCPA